MVIVIGADVNVAELLVLLPLMLLLISCDKWLDSHKQLKHNLGIPAEIETSGT